MRRFLWNLLAMLAVVVLAFVGYLEAAHAADEAGLVLYADELNAQAQETLALCAYTGDRRAGRAPFSRDPFKKVRRELERSDSNVAVIHEAYYTDLGDVRYVFRMYQCEV